MEIFVVRPEGAAASPAVILYMDMWGIRATLADVARRIAATGYCCLLPDVYYRGGFVRYAERDVPGRRLSFAELDPGRRIALRAAIDGLSDAMVIDDTAFLLDLIDRDAAVRHGAVGAVGYCMGGRHALCVAGSFPERFKATACLHGAGLVTAGDRSPHLLARRAEGEIYCGHAERDKYAAPDVVERVDEALRDCRARHQRRVHSGTEHGYALPDRDVYDRDACELDWSAIDAMFKRQLFQGAT